MHLGGNVSQRMYSILYSIYCSTQVKIFFLKKIIMVQTFLKKNTVQKEYCYDFYQFNGHDKHEFAFTYDPL